MRTNGTIQYEITTPGGVNEYGEPIASVTTWCDPIRCSIHANTDTRRGRYEDGLFRQSSFCVLIERNAHLDIDVISAIKRVRLVRGHESLGEHFVLAVVPCDSVGRVQIDV
nr:MAG TPA: hypothetical protein [Caudoviricetes sp.]